MKPTVLFLDHAAVLGGAELSLLDIAARLRDRAAVVLLEDGPFRMRLEAAGVDVHVVQAPAAVMGVTREGGGLGALRSLPGVLQLCLHVAKIARRYDVLYANSQKSFVVASLVGLVTRRPVIWHLRDIMSADHFSASNRRLVAGLARWCSRRVVANSEATAEALRAIGGPADRITVVHNSIDPAPFGEVPGGDAAVVRDELGLKPGPVVGVFSRLAPWKGQHVMLEALAALPGVQALFIGQALFQDEVHYAHDLRAQAEALGVADRVCFAGFRDDVPRLMRLVDVVAHTSVAPEPFGRVVVEGMLAGTPVVAADAGGVREIVVDGRDGLLVAPGDAAALAAALGRVLDDPAYAASLAEAGRARARAVFAPERMMATLDAVIAETARGPGA